MKKFSIKKPNLIATLGSFLVVWLFFRSNAIWAIFQFLGCQRYNKGWRPNFQEPPIFWIKCSHGQNSTSESINKDWTLISTIDAIAVLEWPQAVILQKKKNFRKVRFITKVALALTIDRKLSLSGVADRSFVNHKFVYFPGSRHDWIVSVMSNHSHTSFVLTNLKNKFEKPGGVERCEKESCSEQTEENNKIVRCKL